MARSTGAVSRETPSKASVAHSRATLAVGIFMVLIAFALAYLLLKVWPQSTSEDGQIIWINLTESTALAIAMICGGLGSFVHVATSFSSFAGNRSLKPSWIWWFLLRPPIGAALALMVYFITRSGFLLDGPLGEVVSPTGIAALSATVGLFAKQAIDKLKNVSDVAFNSAQDAERYDKL
ncbi:MAG: hypothetical protein QNJ92_01160 [Alphaproteobacteria bacterium]|nr:hypothetical protein [Alphaproteobacteria bacterium]